MPIPSAIGVNPMSAIAIWTPAGVNDADGGLPAKAVAVHFYPVSVRSERVIKIGGGRYFAGGRCIRLVTRRRSKRWGRDRGRINVCCWRREREV